MDDFASRSKMRGYTIDHLPIGENFAAAQVVRLVECPGIVDRIEAG